MTKKYSKLVGDPEAGFNLSWGSIFAGVVTFIALTLTLSTISSAIGFGLIDFTSADTLNNADTGVLIWSVIVFVLAFAGAGFVSGITARRVGLVHGFLTWATSIIAFVLLLTYITSSALSAAGNALGSAANVAGNALGSAGNAVTSAFEGAANNINFDNIEIDTQELGENAEQILEDTEIEELQPDYLQNELQAAGDVIVNAGKDIVVNPENADSIIESAFEDIRAGVEEINNAADEDALTNAIQNNSDLSEAESRQTAQNFITGAEETVNEASNAIDDAQTQLAETRQNVEQDIQQLQNQAAQTATNATDTASKASIWIFVGLVLSAIISSAAGLFGSNLVRFSPKEGNI